MSSIELLKSLQPPLARPPIGPTGYSRLGGWKPAEPRFHLVEIVATVGREVSFDPADSYHNESRLYGVDTLKRDLKASDEVLDSLTACLSRETTAPRR